MHVSRGGDTRITFPVPLDARGNFGLVKHSSQKDGPASKMPPHLSANAEDGSSADYFPCHLQPS